ncbi:hypothetical protein [Aquimarina algicola]|uniref:hypothetical protein n=1 Tax=Aquimarina algicola TaxID=2589995 RepID=UPI001CF18211|nr:hypothetical protein [Aquimarina algicola]
MTEEELRKRLMEYKKKHGVTKEILQNYHWALETIRERQKEKEKNNNSSKP